MGSGTNHTHAPATPAKGRFNDQRIADFFRNGFNFRRVRINRLFGTGDDWNSGLLRKFARRRLVAQRLQQFRAGTNKGDANSLTSSRQRWIFAKEAVTGMNRIHFFFGSELNDGIYVEVRLYRPFALANQVGFVGFKAVQAESIFFRIDGDSAQSQFSSRAENARRDFAAIECHESLHRF